MCPTPSPFPIRPTSDLQHMVMAAHLSHNHSNQVGILNYEADLSVFFYTEWRYYSDIYFNRLVVTIAV